MATKTKKTPAQEAAAQRRQQRRFLAKALSNPEVTDDMLKCMDPSTKHDWDLTNDYHVVPASTEGRRLTHIARDYVCNRCTKAKRENYVLTRREGQEILERRSLEYTGGIDIIPGAPRGVRPAEIVRAEQYRRSLEKALRVPKGTRLHASR